MKLNFRPSVVTFPWVPEVNILHLMEKNYAVKPRQIGARRRQRKKNYYIFFCFSVRFEFSGLPLLAKKNKTYDTQDTITYCTV